MFSILFLFKFFNIRQWLSGISFPVNWVNAKGDSMLTEPQRSETPRQLSQLKWWNLHTCWRLLHWLSWSRVSLRVDSVDMESHFALTQLMWSLTLRSLSWWGVSLRIDPVCRRWINLKQAYTTSSGGFKKIGFRKINHEKFKWPNIKQKMIKVCM